MSLYRKEKKILQKLHEPQNIKNLKINRIENWMKKGSLKIYN